MGLHDAKNGIKKWTEILSNPTRLAKVENNITVRSILEKGITFRELSQIGVPRSDVAMVLDLQIVRFLESLNIKNTMSDYQIEEMVSTMIQKYPTETIMDFQLMFRMAKHGMFGPVYNRLDITVIMEYMGKYLEHKAFEVEQMNRQVGKEAPAPREKFVTDEQFEQYRDDFYKNKLVLSQKLAEIDKHQRDMKRRGIVGMDPSKVAEYEKFRNQEFAKYKQKLDDATRGNRMDSDADGPTPGHVPVPDDSGGGNVE